MSLLPLIVTLFCGEWPWEGSAFFFPYPWLSHKLTFCLDWGSLPLSGHNPTPLGDGLLGTRFDEGRSETR
jgi:hypothetical protein